MIAIDLLLGLAVLAAWLAAWGFARLSSACDRLHCVTFAGLAAGVPVAAAAFFAKGFASGPVKVLLIILMSAAIGAALAHAAGRAIAVRDADGATE